MSKELPIDQKVFDAAVKWIALPWSGGVSNYIVCPPKTDVTGRGSHGTQCHSALSYGSHEGEMVIDRIKNRAEQYDGRSGNGGDTWTKDDRIAMIDWVTSPEFPLSKHIVNRDHPSKYDGLIILITDGMKTREALWLCKAIARSFSEAPLLPKVWNILVKGGVHPLLAHLVASHIRSGTKNCFKYTGNEGHSSVWCCNPSEKQIENLLQYKLAKDGSSTQSNQVWWSAARDGYNATNCSLIEKMLQPIMKPHETDDGWGNKTKVSGATSEELVKTVLDFQLRLEGKIEPPKMPGRDTIFAEVDL